MSGSSKTKVFAKSLASLILLIFFSCQTKNPKFTDRSLSGGNQVSYRTTRGPASTGTVVKNEKIFSDSQGITQQNLQSENNSNSILATGEIDKSGSGFRFKVIGAIAVVGLILMWILSSRRRNSHA